VTRRSRLEEPSMVLLGRQLPEAPPVRRSRGSQLVSWITSTDHKVIGHLY